MDHEEVYFFTKSARYYFKQQFVPYKESTRSASTSSFAMGRGSTGRGTRTTRARAAWRCWNASPTRTSTFRDGRCIPCTGGGRTARASPRCGSKGRTCRRCGRSRSAVAGKPHFAAYPEKLVKIAVLAGCPEGGIVLDPFSGSGTTGIVCERLKRSYLGIELNPGVRRDQQTADTAGQGNRRMDRLMLASAGNGGTSVIEQIRTTPELRPAMP